MQVPDQLLNYTVTNIIYSDSKTRTKITIQIDIYANGFNDMSYWVTHGDGLRTEHNNITEAFAQL